MAKNKRRGKQKGILQQGFEILNKDKDDSKNTAKKHPEKKYKLKGLEISTIPALALIVILKNYTDLNLVLIILISGMAAVIFGFIFDKLKWNKYI